ncbi:MAG: cysteine--tRNA ligase [Alphaproteobacteria bacterium]|nr:MAG: cysteine--tRNA ligase [Alphaproteobacteria bacterium]
MTLHLYNTAHRAKEEFVPLRPGKVGMYVCGPTVYDLAHIGNARPVVIFDVLARLLRHLGYDLTYVRNITDVEDKIIAAAEANGESIEALTTRTTKAFHDDMAALNALPPDIEPRATEHIGGMIAMIETLIRKGHAYTAEGHVLFDVNSMPDYGKLSGRNRDDMIAGARVEVAPYKKDPADFVLWKPSTGNMPGWESPFGRGRPGWHIECSVMSEAALGETFDIHGGGRDLIFPHHENEVAQSCCAHDGAPFARYWVHNGFLTVEGDKMSKSLGNFRTVRELLADAPGEALRLNMLSAQYRQPLDWTSEGVARSKKSLDRIYSTLLALNNTPSGTIEPTNEVVAALEDDLNTPLALSALYALAKKARRSIDPNEQAILKGQLIGSGHILGLLEIDPEVWFHGEIPDEEAEYVNIDVSDHLDVQINEEIDRLINERADAKKNKNFARADEIRDNLKADGIILEDGPGGTTWKRA